MKIPSFGLILIRAEQEASRMPQLHAAVLQKQVFRNK